MSTHPPAHNRVGGDLPADLPLLRSLHGESTRLWAAAQVRVEPERWIALSGARSVDFNVALCHGGGVNAVSRTVQELLAEGTPALMMVAGGALGEVQALIEAGWVCIGSVPFMARGLDEPGMRKGSLPRAGAVEAIDEQGLSGVRALIAEVFDLGEELAQVALPPDVLDREGQTVWAAFAPDGAIASCLLTVVVHEVVVVWSMATKVGARRRGYGRQVLEAALGQEAARGTPTALLHSSAAGETFYRSAGFFELERWQLWSRPRWVLGRA